MFIGFDEVCWEKVLYNHDDDFYELFGCNCYLVVSDDQRKLEWKSGLKGREWEEL